jgi:hypothetical protein
VVAFTAGILSWSSGFSSLGKTNFSLQGNKLKLELQQRHFGSALVPA